MFGEIFFYILNDFCIIEHMTTRQEQARKTKHHIYRTATSLFATSSYEQVTIRDICKSANISIGGFYHYFDSKMDLLNAGFEMFDEQCREHYQEKTFENNIQAIEFLVQDQSSSINSIGYGAATQIFKSQVTSDDKYILNEERFFYQTLYQHVLQAIEQKELKGDAKTITSEILMITRGIIYDWGLHEGSYDLVEKSLKMVRMVLKYYQ